MNKKRIAREKKCHSFFLSSLSIHYYLILNKLQDVMYDETIRKREKKEKRNRWKKRIFSLYLLYFYIKTVTVRSENCNCIANKSDK